MMDISQADGRAIARDAGRQTIDGAGDHAPAVHTHTGADVTSAVASATNAETAALATNATNAATAANSLLLAGHSPEEFARKLANTMNTSAVLPVVADDTSVGTGVAIVIPGPSILHGLLIYATAPHTDAEGGAGGILTIDYSVGTVANDNGTLAGTDVDIMIAAGPQTEASIHGDAANDHVAAYFPMGGHGRYFAANTNIYLNIIGKASEATATPGNVMAEFRVVAIYTPLPALS